MCKEEKWYCVAGIGRDGIEMLTCTKDKIEASNKVFPMELRCRVNTHRYISLYSWEESFEVTWDKMEERQYKTRVLRDATCLFLSPWDDKN